MSKESVYQPRFLAYCLDQGRSPAAQLAHDRAEYPGGCMAGFIIWGNAQVAAFRGEHPQAFTGSGRLADHPAYDQWLSERFAACKGSGGEGVETP